MSAVLRFERSAKPAVDPDLDAAIVMMAKRFFPEGFDVADDAPSSYAELVAHLRGGQRMRVWSGASDSTIFGSASVNYAQRAWHDWHHYSGGHDFTIPGEAATVLTQANELKAAFGAHPRARLWRALMFGDIIGLGLYADLHDGEFPVDQRSFVLAFVRAILPDAKGMVG